MFLEETSFSCVDRCLWLCYDATMPDVSLVSFLNKVMRLRKRLPSQLAADLGVSHATVSRWLSGRDIPSIRSCRKLAEYSGVPLEKVFSIVGHLPKMEEGASPYWPEFREYARHKYPKEIDEDLIAVIEDLIQRRRERNDRKNS